MVKIRFRNGKLEALDGIKDVVNYNDVIEKVIIPRLKALKSVNADQFYAYLAKADVALAPLTHQIHDRNLSVDPTTQKTGVSLNGFFKKVDLYTPLPNDDDLVIQVLIRADVKATEIQPYYFPPVIRYHTGAKKTEDYTPPSFHDSQAIFPGMPAYAALEVVRAPDSLLLPYAFTEELKPIGFAIENPNNTWKGYNCNPFLAKSSGSSGSSGDGNGNGVFDRNQLQQHVFKEPIGPHKIINVIHIADFPKELLVNPYYFQNQNICAAILPQQKPGTRVILHESPQTASKIITRNDIYTDDRIDDISRKLKNIKPNGGPIYIWAGSRAISVILEKPFSKYNVNPFLATFVNNMEEGTTSENSERLKDVIGDEFDDLHVAFYKDVSAFHATSDPNAKDQRSKVLSYYFNDDTKKNDLVEMEKIAISNAQADQKQKLWKVPLSKHLELMTYDAAITNICNFGEIQYSIIVPKTKEIWELFDDFKTSKNISLVRWNFDPTHILYKLHKNHNLSRSDLHNIMTDLPLVQHNSTIGYGLMFVSTAMKGKVLNAHIVESGPDNYEVKIRIPNTNQLDYYELTRVRKLILRDLKSLLGLHDLNLSISKIQCKTSIHFKNDEVKYFSEKLSDLKSYSGGNKFNHVFDIVPCEGGRSCDLTLGYSNSLIELKFDMDDKYFLTLRVTKASSLEDIRIAFHMVRALILSYLAYRKENEPSGSSAASSASTATLLAPRARAPSISNSPASSNDGDDNEEEDGDTDDYEEESSEDEDDDKNKKGGGDRSWKYAALVRRGFHNIYPIEKLNQKQLGYSKQCVAENQPLMFSNKRIKDHKKRREYEFLVNSEKVVKDHTFICPEHWCEDYSMPTFVSEEAAKEAKAKGAKGAKAKEGTKDAKRPDTRALYKCESSTLNTNVNLNPYTLQMNHEMCCGIKKDKVKGAAEYIQKNNTISDALAQLLQIEKASRKASVYVGILTKWYEDPVYLVSQAMYPNDVNPLVRFIEQVKRDLSILDFLSLDNGNVYLAFSKVQPLEIDPKLENDLKEFGVFKMNQSRIEGLKVAYDRFIQYLGSYETKSLMLLYDLFLHMNVLVLIIDEHHENAEKVKLICPPFRKITPHDIENNRGRPSGLQVLPVISDINGHVRALVREKYFVKQGISRTETAWTFSVNDKGIKNIIESQYQCGHAGEEAEDSGAEDIPHLIRNQVSAIPKNNKGLIGYLLADMTLVKVVGNGKSMNMPFRIPLSLLPYAVKTWKIDQLRFIASSVDDSMPLIAYAIKDISKENALSKKVVLNDKWAAVQQQTAQYLLRNYEDVQKIIKKHGNNKSEIIKELTGLIAGSTDSAASMLVQVTLEEIPFTQKSSLTRWMRLVRDKDMDLRPYNSSAVHERNGNEYLFSQAAFEEGLPTFIYSKSDAHVNFEMIGLQSPKELVHVVDKKESESQENMSKKMKNDNAARKAGSTIRTIGISRSPSATP